MVQEPRTSEKQRMWDVINTCSTWVYEPIKQVWVYVVLPCIIRITIPGCVVLLDLAHIRLNIPWKKVQLMKTIELQPDQEVGEDGCNRRLMKFQR